jgi:hypothetical protein
VFEHVPDDLKAMGEYARILSPTGIGFVQNPWRTTGVTQEDPSASVEERIKRFGQADHVRIYGVDFEDRLRSVGLDPRRLLPEAIVPSAAIDSMAIRRDMPIWMVCGSAFPYSPMTPEFFMAAVRGRVEEFLGRLRTSDPPPARNLVNRMARRFRVGDSI